MMPGCGGADDTAAAAAAGAGNAGSRSGLSDQFRDASSARRASPSGDAGMSEREESSL